MILTIPRGYQGVITLPKEYWHENEIVVNGKTQKMDREITVNQNVSVCIPLEN